MSAGDKINILVVDDLPEKRLVLQTVLEELGQNVMTAGSGEEALGLILEHDFAVILLDVLMPGMTGYEAAALIRKRKKSAHTPIIFITAFADEMHTAHGYALGAVDYILTPVVPEVLRTKVKVFVELFRMTQQAKRQADERVALAREQAARAAAEEATRRSQFLAEASTVLASSLEQEETVRGLLRLAVPRLADVAAVTLVGEAGHPWRSELAWARPAGGEVCFLTLSSPEGPDDELRRALERVLASGRSEAVEGLAVPYPPRSAGGGAEYVGRLDSAILVPLRARGHTLGALTLALRESGRRRGPADLALADDLAGRAAIALDNARLYRDVQEADRRKNDFLSMLAHELRNPLAPIRNAVQVLRLKGPDQPEVRWAQEMIDRQLQHLVRLVDDLLDVSRITRGKVRLQTEPVDVATLVTRAVETSRPLIDARRHELSVGLPPEPVRVQGDVIRLSQVLANLLNNAAKFTDEGGRIWLNAERQGADVVLRVRDTGVGIPGAMLGSVFDLFTQADRSLDRSQGGLGIGLTLVRHLVEMHGGSVGASSAGPNQGSEFTVRLPALAEAPPPARAGGAEPPAGAPRRVLLVEDHADAAESLARLLRLAGHEVRTAGDGLAAVEAVRDFRPEVVLLDIGLPGLDGYEVARRLRRLPETAGALLVALTGYGQEEDRRRAREAGFDHHLVKPADLHVLQELLAAKGGRRCGHRAG